MSKSLCDSCINYSCIFQSGIIRSQCAFYIAKETLETILNNYKLKTGHWIIDTKDDNYCFCSECNHRFNIDHLKFCWDKYSFPPHCPNCGCHMVEKE